jgi:hypothetical protein
MFLPLAIVFYMSVRDAGHVETPKLNSASLLMCMPAPFFLYGTRVAMNAAFKASVFVAFRMYSVRELCVLTRVAPRQHKKALYLDAMYAFVYFSFSFSHYIELHHEVKQLLKNALFLLCVMGVMRSSPSRGDWTITWWIMTMFFIDYMFYQTIFEISNTGSLPVTFDFWLPNNLEAQVGLGDVIVPGLYLKHAYRSRGYLTFLYMFVAYCATLVYLLTQQVHIVHPALVYILPCMAAMDLLCTTLAKISLRYGLIA